MRLVTYALEAATAKVGVLRNDKVLDLEKVLGISVPCMADAIGVLHGNAANLQKVMDHVSSSDESALVHNASLKAPILTPEKLICVGLNYVDHCEEQGVPIPKEPVIFSKFASAIIGPGQPIQTFPETQELDFEVELALVIGKEGRRIARDAAMSHIFGVTVAHDVSARDIQLRRNGGKCFDTSCPLGPSIVTLDEVGDPHNLRLGLTLNGKVMQDSSTSQLVFKSDALVEYISKFVTLKPGDVILTGTPPGVGCFRKPPIYLKPGDVVTCFIDGVGELTNAVE